MQDKSVPERQKIIQELLAFKVGGEHDFAVDIIDTLGINRLSQVTRVHQAPPYVRGIINLRGQVVTVIDLAVKFGGKSTKLTPESRIIIVRDKDEDIGLLVDSIIDVIPVGNGGLEPPPANLGGILGRHFAGVYREQTRLIGILDVPSIIQTEI